MTGRTVIPFPSPTSAPVDPRPISGRTRFELRRRRIKVNRRDVILFGEREFPELTAYLEALELRLVAESIKRDLVVADWLEWYDDEWSKYGPRVRAGLAALYWAWSSTFDGRRHLDAETYADRRDDMAASIQPEVLDGELTSGRTIVQEFIWWSAGEWLFLPHLVEAMNEFEEYYLAGKMPEWRRKKRRRLAAERRKAIKAMYHASAAA